MNPFDLNGKIALVTGGSYGIGFSIASGYGKAGATVVFNDINQELVDKGIAAYAAEGIKAHGYVCDVTNEEQVNAMVAQIEAEVGVIDILVNNAGIIRRADAVDFTEKDWDDVMNINIKTVFFFSQAVAKQMIKQGHGGKIISVASMLSFQGGIRVPSYTASKSGVMGVLA